MQLIKYLLLSPGARKFFFWNRHKTLKLVSTKDQSTVTQNIHKVWCPSFLGPWKMCPGWRRNWSFKYNLCSALQSLNLTVLSMDLLSGMRWVPVSPSVKQFLLDLPFTTMSHWGDQRDQCLWYCLKYEMSIWMFQEMAFDPVKSCQSRAKEHHPTNKVWFQ